jgi:hypothetical protein
MVMLDALTLDQLRTFIAAVDEGSFSAAGRKLRRAQSVVSQTLANLEAQLGIKLFDRSARYPRLTEEGRSLLPDARAVADNIDGFKARARAMRGGSRAGALGCCGRDVPDGGFDQGGRAQSKDVSAHSSATVCRSIGRRDQASARSRLQHRRYRLACRSLRTSFNQSRWSILHS